MFKLDYDPAKVGKTEQLWWKAHNEKNKPEMIKLMIEEHIQIYRMDGETAMKALIILAGGTQYHDVRDWEGAKRAANEYYEMIKEHTGLSFDSQKMAELEIGWWILHDELEHIEDKTELAKAFAALYAAEFGVDEEKLMEAGRKRAQATYEHDLAEDPQTPVAEIDKHWDNTAILLGDFYRELKRVANERG